MKFEIVHEVPGRLRVSFGGKLPESHACVLEEHFASMAAVSKCVAYPKAGSLAITYMLSSEETFEQNRELILRELEELDLVRAVKDSNYVRRIPVVKVFQQTVYSFKAFYDAIQDFSAMAQDYAVKWCQVPQSLSLAVINGAVVFVIPVILLLIPGETNVATFIANVAFYSIFMAIIPTAMTRVMFMSEAFQVAADSLQRVKGILAAPRNQNGRHVRTASRCVY